MIDIDNSWQFLSDFYLHDKSIVLYVNRALRIKSKMTVRDTSFNVFMGDVLSFLPNSIENTSYKSFLQYTYLGSGDYSDISIEELENRFLMHMWINVLSNSAANRYLSSEITNNPFPGEYIPYLLLRTFGIEIEWLLYGGKSANIFINNNHEDLLPKLFQELKRGYRVWHNPWRFYTKLGNIKSKLLHTRQLSSEQLYAVMIFFIVLRREWEESKDTSYIRKKIGTYSKLWSISDITKAFIFSIYDQYKERDEEICIEYKKVATNIDIKLHSLIAKHIIDSKSYKDLFDSEFSISGSIDESKKKLWINTETLCSKMASGKRLLLDYYFPHTIIREEDVFIPTDSSITDKIYISLQKGKEYKTYWRETYENELFDYIVLYPERNSSNEISDSRPIKYRNNLSIKGEFVIVQDELSAKIEKALKEGFSFFRHDLKDLADGIDIRNLMILLEDLKWSKSSTEKLIRCIEELLSDFDNTDSLENAKRLLREYENLLYTSRRNPQLLGIVKNIRDCIEDFSYSNDSTVLSRIKIEEIKSSYDSSFEKSFDKIVNAIDNVMQKHETLCSYIKIAGTKLNNNQDSIAVCDFLSHYIKHLSLNKRRVNISCDFSNINNDLTIRYNKAVLIVVLNSIIDNAINHGFANYECDNPTIMIITTQKDDYLLLKVCNNGKPITISNADYKTRGVFKGETGHTGIGGYQISKYAELQGGYVEIPKVKEWNTEIHLYIKLHKL